MIVGKLRLICSGLREPELLAVLPGDRASSQHDSFSGKMVLNKLFLSDSGCNILKALSCTQYE